jgi:hypothetical protein
MPLDSQCDRVLHQKRTLRCFLIVERARIERDCPPQELGGEDPFLVRWQRLECFEEFGGRLLVSSGYRSRQRVASERFYPLQRS